MIMQTVVFKPWSQDKPPISIGYDAQSDTLYVEGMPISADLIRMFDTTPPGIWMRFKKLPDGCIEVTERHESDFKPEGQT